MNCPVCHDQPLAVLELHQIEIDYCDSCHGVWLDAGELELLFGDASACERFLTIGSPTAIPQGERKRRCPICDRKMAKESTEGPYPVIFDHCARGDGLWFDRGELQTILAHPDAIASPVSDLLADIFGNPDPRNVP